MAQLKDLIVNGATRLIGDAYVDTIQITKLNAPTSAGGSTYGVGSENQVLLSNGSSIYWGKAKISSFTNDAGYITSDEKLKIAAVTSGTTYYPIVAANSTAAANRQYDATGFAYVGTNGTTSAVGAAKITLGNSTASGTANNKQGSIVLYGSTAYATTITPGAPSAARTITLPNGSGTIALSSNPIIAADSGTATVSLTANTTYKLTAGGGSLIFKTPVDTNTDTKVTQAYSTTNDSYPLLLSATNGVTSTGSRGATTSILNNSFYANPNTGTLSTKNLVITDTSSTARIEFSRVGTTISNAPNYIQFPASSRLNFVGGDTRGNDVSMMILESDPTTPSIFPGTTDTVNLGTTSLKWNNIYAKTVTLSQDPVNNLEAATKQYVDNAFIVNDAMLFKGVVNANGDLPTTHKQGWTYKVGTAGTYAGKTCEVGDTIYCVTDGTAANNNHWVVVQANVDAPLYKDGNTFAGSKILLSDGTGGKVKEGTTAGAADLPIYLNNGVPTTITSYKGKAATAGVADSANAVAWGNVSSKPTVNSPSASETEISFIDTVSQSNGTISATKKTVRDASASQSGVVNTTSQVFAGNKTFTGVNTTIGRNIIRQNVSAPGQGDLVLTALGYKTGYPVYTDPTFLSGTNSIGVYNNSNNGNVIHTRDKYSTFGVASPGTGSEYVLRIQNIGTANPGIGGFMHSISSRANAQFIQIFRALIPVGRNVTTASNNMGDTYQDQWLTPQAGTGKWEWYARRVICGQTGTFSNGGHVYLDGAAGTSSAPVTWYLASCNVYDITKTQYDGLRTRYADAADTATNASTATSAGKWDTARTLTIGNKGQSVDGSQDVSWDLHDILIRGNNEVNFTSNGITSLWINYKTQTGTSAATKITGYHFGNGQGGVTDVNLYAETFNGNLNGNASTATTASKLSNTAKIGDTNKPVYFTASGVPAAINYTIAKSVPSDAKFTDTVTTVTTSGSGNAITAISASNGAITATKGSTFLTSHQDISGKADKSATVSTVAWNSTNKKITKTINGSSTDVVQFVAGDNITLTGASGKLTISSTGNDAPFIIPIGMSGSAVVVTDSTITAQMIYDNCQNCIINSSDYGFIETTCSKTSSNATILGKAYYNIGAYDIADFILFEIVATPSSNTINIYRKQGNESINNDIHIYGKDTSTYNRPLLVGSIFDTSLNSSLGFARYNPNVYLTPSTGTITATTFSGALSGNASTATKLSNTPNTTTTYLRGDNSWQTLISSGNSTLAWNSEITLATVGGTAIKAKLPTNPNTDIKVKQTVKSDNVNYKLLMGANSSPTSGTAYEAVYDTAITVNPSTDTITATNFAGNATTATTASKLGTANKGSGTKPIYLAAGVPTECNNDFVPFKGNITSIGASSPASGAKTYWADTTNVPSLSTAMAYNNSGSEYTLLFSKGGGNNYGTILKWGYSDNYLRMLRYHYTSGTNSDKWYSEDWEKISSGYADSAGSATKDGSGNTIASTYVKKVGDTMTGYLTYKDATIDASKTNNGISSMQYPTTFNITDKNDKIVARQEALVNTNGDIGSYWYVRNYNTSGTQVGQKGIKMAMNKSGLLSTIMDGDIAINGNNATKATRNNWDACSRMLFRPKVDSRTAYGYIACYDDGDDADNGVNMVVVPGGNMIIGGGESAANIYQNAVYGKTGYSSNIESVGQVQSTFKETAEDTIITSDNWIFFLTNCNNIASRYVSYINGAGEYHGVKVYGAVYNDYAEMRNVPEAQNENNPLRPGTCVREVGDGTMVPTTERLQRGCKIISDTFGFNIGKTDNCKTPIAVSGRALVYLDQDREIARDYIGWPVCSGPNGTVSIMTEEEEEKYPSRIVGTISEIPNYEKWGSSDVEVNGRIWIYVR